MKTIGFKQLSLFLGAATLLLGFNLQKAQAQTVSSNTNQETTTTPNTLEQAPLNIQNNEATAITAPSKLATTSPDNSRAVAQPIPGTTKTSAAILQKAGIVNSVTPNVAQSEGPTPGNAPPTTAPGNARPDLIVPTTPAPTPGTFTPAPSTPTQTTPTDTTPRPLPGTSTISPGRATNSGSSYFGVGGNIGLGDGDTAIGEGSFAIISKIGLTRNFSVRPSALIGDNVTILLPVTYDFSFGEGPTGELGFTAAPFLGVGAAISTGDGASADLLLTGGIDVPLGSQFTATGSVNASVTGKAAVGLLLGIGYNFRGF